MLDYNTINLLDLPLNNHKDDINPGTSNNGKEGIRLADMDNNKEDIREIDIDKQRYKTPNEMPQNGLLSELSSTFKQTRFRKYEFSFGTSVLDTQYKHFESQKNNPFYPFHSQLNYALAHYFANSETTKNNFDKFSTNPLMKPITKNVLYFNTNK